jgi:hypothetical protein
MGFGEWSTPSVTPISSVGVLTGGDTINITVNGWVGNDQDIVQKFREELIDIKRSNGTSGID